MPLALNRGDRRVLVLGGIVLMLMLGIAFVIASGTGDRGEVTTSYSSSSAGCKAIYLLLAESAVRDRDWARSSSGRTTQDRCLIALLCEGHALVEGVPGVAKTLTIKTLVAAARTSGFSACSARPI